MFHEMKHLLVTGVPEVMVSLLYYTKSKIQFLHLFFLFFFFFTYFCSSKTFLGLLESALGVLSPFPSNTVKHAGLPS